jgi:hypothetical protein
VTEQPAVTFAVTRKVEVLVVAAAAGVEATPSARNPTTAADKVDKAVFDNFIANTPGTAKNLEM